MEDITDVDYKHAKKVCKDLKKKWVNTAIYMFKVTHHIANAFNNLSNICLEIYELHSSRFI